jgi:hypothetical protein
MTDVYGTPKKKWTRSLLFKIGVEALRKQGYEVKRIDGSGKSSVRRIAKGNQNLKVSIRTTQDKWIAFPRNGDDTAWITLSEVDAVVAVSVDNVGDPKIAQVHMLPGDDLRQRFDRAYRARIDAGYQIPLGRGVWVSLYREEADEPVVNVGAGAGLAYPPFAQVPLQPKSAAVQSEPSGNSVIEPRTVTERDGEQPLTIPEAKRRLALYLGVDPSSIKITVEA